jgi:hypothetical protein
LDFNHQKQLEWSQITFPDPVFFVVDQISFVGSLGSPALALNPNEYSLDQISSPFSLGELGDIAGKRSNTVRIAGKEKPSGSGLT